MQSFASSPSRWAVVVPAQNEADYLAAALDALNHAAIVARQRVGVLVFANGCADDTRDVALRCAPTYSSLILKTVSEDLPRASAHAGGARRRATDIASQVFGLRSHDRLFSTDADARVSPELFLRMDRAFSLGADLVLAQLTYLKDRYDPAPETALLTAERHAAWRQRVRQLVEAVRTGRVPSPLFHDEYGGAGIAARVDAYESLGGFPSIPTSEDKALVALADLRGMNVCRQSGATVAVCTRLKGRASGGMADTLARFASMAPSAAVAEHHQDTWRRILAHRCHAAAFPRTVGRWEPIEEAITGLDRYLARYQGKDAGDFA